MAETTVRKITSIAELERSDVVRHKHSGLTVVIDANYGKYAIGITHQHIENPEEWEIVVTGVRSKEQVEESSVVASGDYTLQIEEVEIRGPGEDRERLMLKCVIVGTESPFLRDALIGKTINQSFALNTRGYPFMQALYRACGVPTSSLLTDATNASKLRGCMFDCTVGQTDSFGGYNTITNERAVPEGRGPYR